MAFIMVLSGVAALAGLLNWMATRKAAANPCATNTDVCARSGVANCERDFDEGYDGSQCACVACPNVRLCGRWMPSVFLGCNRGYCTNCAVLWGKTLSFVEMTEECPVCLGQPVGGGVRHPAGCGHVFCVPCTRRLFYGSGDDDDDDDRHTECPLCRKR
jgi:hypothetical protein